MRIINLIALVFNIYGSYIKGSGSDYFGWFVESEIEEVFDCSLDNLKLEKGSET